MYLPLIHLLYKLKIFVSGVPSPLTLICSFYITSRSCIDLIILNITFSRKKTKVNLCKKRKQNASRGGISRNKNMGWGCFYMKAYS